MQDDLLVRFAGRLPDHQLRGDALGREPFPGQDGGTHAIEDDCHSGGMLDQLGQTV